MSKRKTRTNDRSKSIVPIRYVLYGVFGLAFVLQGTAVRRWTQQGPTNVPTLPARHETLPLEQPEYPLPDWIVRYFRWHREMRTKYPGATIFTDPSAPPLLIRTCLGLCGGLHDRLGQLPWDLYLANQTKRVLLISWHRPVPLEHFVRPNLIDWSVPRDVPGFFPTGDARVVSRHGMKHIRAYTEFFAGLEDETHPDAAFMNQSVDAALERAVSGVFRDVRVLRHRLLGHVNEEALERRLQQLGETDLIHSTPTFGYIFHSFFRLAPDLVTALDAVYAELNLRPGHYSGVHCRVRHPKAYTAPVKSKVDEFTADKTGLRWEGEARNMAVQVATRAIQCATKYFQEREPIYFFSDSNDLVRYMAKELTSPAAIRENKLMFANSPVDAAALSAVQATTLVARDMTMENAHIDKQKGREPSAYYMTFIDLFLAIHARCLAIGVGYYAMFAAKISGTQCKVQYDREQWGDLPGSKQTIDVCVLPLDEAATSR